MSNYTRTTNFTAKDSLPTGNANKVVKGSEIQTELDNIATAIGTKADSASYAPLASPALTGTPTAPTATTGTSTTQIATTAFVQATAMSAALPNQTGNSGKIITTDGTNASWGTYSVTNGAFTQATNKLLGRTTASTGAIEEISVVGATFAANTLTITPSAVKLLSTVTASNSATVDIETTLDSTYDAYLIVCSGITVATDGAGLFARMKIGGSYLTTLTYYSHLLASDSSATTNVEYNESGAAYMELIRNIGNAAGEHANLTIHLHNPASTSLRKGLYATGYAVNAIGNTAMAYAVGSNSGTGALTGLRLYASSGNIVSGSFRLYGIVNS